MSEIVKVRCVCNKLISDQRLIDKYLKEATILGKEIAAERDARAREIEQRDATEFQIMNAKEELQKELMSKIREGLSEIREKLGVNKLCCRPRFIDNTKFNDMQYYEVD